jgi:hypothetical protein
VITSSAAIAAIALAAGSSDAAVTGGTGPGGVGRTDGTSNLQLWLSAETISGLADGQTVATWNDQSGKGNTATASGTPEYQSTSINGRPAVHFTPADLDFFNTTNTISTSAESVFFVGGTDVGGDQALLGNTWSQHYTLRDRGGVFGWNIGGFAWTAVDGLRDFAPDSNDTPMILSGVRIANATGYLSLFQDGTLKGFASETPYRYGGGPGSQYAGEFHTSGAINGAYVIGRRHNHSGEFYGGNFGEVAAFDRDLNEAERILVENHLSTKWDIDLDDNAVYNGDYSSDLFGVGRVDADNLLAETGAAGMGIAADTETLDDGEWLVAAHNGSANSLTPQDVPDGLHLRWDRVWQLDATGDVDATLTFGFDDSGLSRPDFLNSFSLLYSPTNAFSFSALPLAATDLGDQVSFEVPGSLLADGFYTLGAHVPEPSALVLLLLGWTGLFIRRPYRRPTSVG